MALTQGERIAFTYKGRRLAGLVLQLKDGDASVKLDTGYNLVVPERDIEDPEPAHSKRKAHAPEAQAHVPKDPSLKTVTILHTGGTIASKVDYGTGGVIARFTPEDIVAQFPDLKEVVNVESRLVRNMFSGDIRFAHYNILAREIEKEIAAGAQGVIITHGTDTMHYTSAALAFMLEHLPVPVVLVGAQRSSDRGSSDAGMNLLCAASFIAKTAFAGVAICMHEGSDDSTCVVLDGLHARKLHSSRRDAFRPVNALPLARVDARTREVTPLRPALAQADGSALKVTHIEEGLRIGMLYARPNVFADEIARYRDYDGLVIVGTGLGHLSVDAIDDVTQENDRIYAEIGRLAQEIPVVMTTQCINGQVKMDVYQYGRKLQQAGVVGNHCAMHPETAYIKLAWLLSNHKAKVRELFCEDLRGENAQRLPIESQYLD